MKPYRYALATTIIRVCRWTYGVDEIVILDPSKCAEGTRFRSFRPSNRGGNKYTYLAKTSLSALCRYEGSTYSFDVAILCVKMISIA